jgi:hypothetical protein
MSISEFANKNSPNPISFLIALSGMAEMSLATAAAVRPIQFHGILTLF